MVACQRYFCRKVEGFEKFVVPAVIGGVDFHHLRTQNPIMCIHQKSDIQRIDFRPSAQVDFKVGINAVEALPMAVLIVIAAEAAVKKRRPV